MALSREEKERILRAIEKDREFRYALMGLLGFSEILERITRLESEVEETKRVVYVIGYRFGVISEAGLREVLKFVVEEVVGAGRVERVILRDEE